jgi:hypothetical protein
MNDKEGSLDGVELGAELGKSSLQQMRCSIAVS